jgi:hypothetical protein
VDDDLKKYVEFLQRQLLTAGAEDVFNATRAVSALSERADHLRGVWHRQTGHSEVVDDLVQMHAAFTPETPYEVPQTAAIFQPLVTDITATARRRGIQSDSVLTASSGRRTSAVHRIRNVRVLQLLGEDVYGAPARARRIRSEITVYRARSP